MEEEKENKKIFFFSMGSDSRGRSTRPTMARSTRNTVGYSHRNKSLWKMKLALVIKIRYTTAGQFKIYFRSVLCGTLQAYITSSKDSY